MDEHRRYTTICREGLFYLFVLAFIIGGGLLRQMNLLIALAGVMIALLVFNWRVAAATIRRLAFRRGMPQHVWAGESFAVDVVASNPRKQLDAWSVVVEDAVRHDNGSPRAMTRRRALLSHIPPGGTARATYRCRIERRGRYQFDRLTVWTRFPLGLVRVSRRITGADVLTVWPRTGRLAPKWYRMVEADLAGRQRSHRGRGLVEGDYYGLRDWRPGDNKRWIHWRATAKLATLEVCEFEQQRNQDLALVVELHQRDEEAEARDAVERAVSFVATAVEDACRRGGRRLTLAVVGRQSHFFSAPPSTKLMHDVLDCLATVEADAAPPLGDVLGQVLRTAAFGTQIVVVSTRRIDPLLLARTSRLFNPARAELALTRISWINVSDPVQLAALFEMPVVQMGA